MRPVAGSSKTPSAIAGTKATRSTRYGGGCAAASRQRPTGRSAASTRRWPPATRPGRSRWPGSAPSKSKPSTTPQPGSRGGAAPTASCRCCPIPEIARLGRTLRAWRVEFLAYHDTSGASNGPTEAINLLIERSRRDTHGFRNFCNYQLRLLLSYGTTWNTHSTAQIRTRSPQLAA
jgi:hypothetical protein